MPRPPPCGTPSRRSRRGLSWRGTSARRESACRARRRPRSRAPAAGREARCARCADAPLRELEAVGTAEHRDFREHRVDDGHARAGGRLRHRGLDPVDVTGRSTAPRGQHDLAAGSPIGNRAEARGRLFHAAAVRVDDLRIDQHERGSVAARVIVIAHDDRARVPGRARCEQVHTAARGDADGEDYRERRARDRAAQIRCRGLAHHHERRHRHGDLVAGQPHPHAVVEFLAQPRARADRAERDRRARNDRLHAAARSRGARAAADRVQRQFGHRDQLARRTALGGKIRGHGASSPGAPAMVHRDSRRGCRANARALVQGACEPSHAGCQGLRRSARS